MYQPVRKIDASQLAPELVFTTARSSGPGGQNVNKVNSKVTLRFDVRQSAILSEEQKNWLLAKWSTRLTTDGELVLVSQEKRSQLQNKQAVVQKFDKLLTKAFERKKVRRATTPTKSAVKNRLQEKSKRGEIKKWRQKPE